MLTGGEIVHQSCEIPHQSLLFSPPVIYDFALFIYHAFLYQMFVINQ